MTANVAPVYSDGETELFEVRAPVSLSVLRPSDAEMQRLRADRVDPFPRAPFVTTDDIEVQIAWTLANLDSEAHEVQVLLDPWNEFGRYWPGLQIVDAQDGEAVPNLSGINITRELPGVKDSEGRSSRVHGTFTFEDMRELATDFATVIKIIEDVAPSEDQAVEDDPRIQLVNHTFHTDNRQGDTPLTDRYRPKRIPGLIGFDIGLRTEEASKIAIEYTVEIVDNTGERVRDDGDQRTPIFEEPDTFVTLSSM